MGETMAAYTLIVNPVAGRGRALALVPRIQSRFRSHGTPLRTIYTNAPGHATRLAATLPLCATILSLGGDGTLHEIAVACIGTERVLGVLPGGSGDDFAFALGIERYEVDEALEIVLTGCVKRVDTGTVNGTPFVNSLGIGFDAEVAHATLHAPLFLRERTAYLYGVLKTLRHLQTPYVTVEVDGCSFYGGPALLVSTQNGPRTGGSFLFAPHADTSDGRLDLVIATNVRRSEVMSLLPQVMKGTHLKHPKVRHTSGKHFRLRWARPRIGHMEGEGLAAAEAFEIQVVPQSLRVLVKK